VRLTRDGDAESANASEMMSENGDEGSESETRLNETENHPGIQQCLSATQRVLSKRDLASRD
jgi:hypothetical protein